MSGGGLFPFTDCNDSNPFAVCGRGPLKNAIVHVQHDDDTTLICRNVERFLELVREAGAEVDQLVGDYSMDTRERKPEDAELARVLIREVTETEMDEWDRGNSLRFATQLFGAGDEDALADVLAAGDENIRNAVRMRWKGLDTDLARQYLAADDAAYQQFLIDFRHAFVDAGVKTESYRGEFLLIPGRVGLNFKLLYSECRRPGMMADWVKRLRP